MFSRGAESYTNQTPVVGYYKKQIWVYGQGLEGIRDWKGCMKYGKKCHFGMVMSPNKVELYIDGESIGTKNDDW